MKGASGAKMLAHMTHSGVAQKQVTIAASSVTSIENAG
jgi:hypothetical protein